MKYKTPIRAKKDIQMSSGKIPKDALGYVSVWTRPIRHLESATGLPVRFPDHHKSVFVCMPEEVEPV